MSEEGQTETSDASGGAGAAPAAAGDGSFLGNAGAAAAAADGSDAGSAAPGDGAAAPAVSSEGEGAPAAPVVPETYDFSIDGLAVDTELADQATPILKDLGLSQEGAAKLLPLVQAVQQRTQAAVQAQLSDALATHKKSLLDAFHADPEIGGPRVAETEHLAAKALDALGFKTGHPFREALGESGFGNHPDMIRAFRRLGELVSEDSKFVRPGMGSTDPRPVWERMYPAEAAKAK